jgi:hypothetical protein
MKLRLIRLASIVRVSTIVIVDAKVGRAIVSVVSQTGIAVRVGRTGRVGRRRSRIARDGITSGIDRDICVRHIRFGWVVDVRTLVLDPTEGVLGREGRTAAQLSAASQ